MKTLENTNVEQKVLAYLNRTAKHLFITENGEFYKVLTYKDKQGRWNFTAITFDGEDKCNIRTVGLNYYIAEYGTNAKNVIKGMVFPDWFNTSAIPNFKLMKGKMYDVHKKLRSGEHNDIPAILKGVTPKK